MTYIKQNWRTYQKDLKRKAARKKLLNSSLRYIILVPLIITVCYAVTLGIQSPKHQTVSKEAEKSVSVTSANTPDVVPARALEASATPPPAAASVPAKPTANTPVVTDVKPENLSAASTTTIQSATPLIIPKNGAQISKQDLRSLIQDKDLANITHKSFNIVAGGRNLHVDTSIDMDLQNFLLEQVQDAKKLKRGKPRYLAMVVLNPETGKVLSMAGFDNTNPLSNPCLSTDFPAASVFKIITAAAAVEQCGLNPNSRMNFNGSRYTLYKGQIKNINDKHSNKISFLESFAQSVNPVFGKLGTYTVGKALIEKYASAFGFNHTIDFEAPVSVSELTVSDEPYKLAEIACGFNRITQISPLHGALLSGTIVNNGQFTEPTIIEQIVDDQGNIVYSGSQLSTHQAIRPETSSVLRKLMASTITNGTGRKSFQGFLKDPVLAQLNIGGKTGSIDNKGHDVRFDWFVGFAEEKNGQQKLSLCVLVGHEKYIGTKACYYARMMMKRYFKNQFAKNDVKSLMAINY